MTNAMVAAKFDAALETATIEIGTLKWETTTTYRVKVSGQWVRGRLTVQTVDGMRDSLAIVLRDYCAGKAAGVL